MFGRRWSSWPPRPGRGRGRGSSRAGIDGTAEDRSGRLPTGEAERLAWVLRTGRDGLALLDGVDAEPADGPWAGLRDLPAIRVLREVWGQQYDLGQCAGGLGWRATECLQPGSERIDSPYDVDSRWSSERSVEWEGYEFHLSEAAEDDLPHLIVAVHTTAPTLADGDLVPELHQDLGRRDMTPGRHFVDGAYTSVELMADALEQGITMIGPLGLDGSRQARAGQGYDRTSFAVDFDAQQAVCPQGRTSTVWSAPESLERRILPRFAEKDCAVCPARALCTTARAGRFGDDPGP